MRYRLIFIYSVTWSSGTLSKGIIYPNFPPMKIREILFSNFTIFPYGCGNIWRLCNLYTCHNQFIRLTMNIGYLYVCINIVDQFVSDLNHKIISVWLIYFMLVYVVFFNLILLGYFLRLYLLGGRGELKRPSPLFLLVKSL